DAISDEKISARVRAFTLEAVRRFGAGTARGNAAGDAGTESGAAASGLARTMGSRNTRVSGPIPDAPFLNVAADYSGQTGEPLSKPRLLRRLQRGGFSISLLD